MLRRFLSVLALVWLMFALGATGYAQRQPKSVPLGQVVAETVEIDGIAVPSGTTLMAGDVVETREAPASIHLTGHRVIQLSANSKARAEGGAGGAVKITVQAGMLWMRSNAGESLSFPAERVLYFTAQGSPAEQTPSQRDVVAVLNAQAEVGNISITVNDVSKVDASQPILIRRPDAELGEAHYIKSIAGNVITLTTALNSVFPRQSLVLQGETTRALLAEPANTGQPPPAVGTASGKSRAGRIALISGIGGGSGSRLDHPRKRRRIRNEQPGESQPALTSELLPRRRTLQRANQARAE